MDPNSQNPYDFIMNPAKPVRRNPFTSGSMVTKIVVGLGVIILIAIIAAVASSAKPTNSNQDNLIAVVQYQNEVKRVAAKFSTANAQAVLNFGSTATLTLYTQQEEYSYYLRTHGVKVSDKILGLKKNPVIDQQLQVARDASIYDQTYLKTMQQELTTYDRVLQTTYNASKSDGTRQLLKKYFDQNQLLLAESKENY